MRRSIRTMWISVSVMIALGTGCGTYSLLRGADNLAAGEFEMTGGITANPVPEVLGVAQLAVGITDWMEFGAQYEVYSALGQLRFGIINSEDHGFAISLGIEGGATFHHAFWTLAEGAAHIGFKI